MENNKSNVKNMAFESLTAVLDLSAEGFQAGVKAAEDSIGSLEDRAASAGQRMQSAGAMMTGAITAPLVAVGALSIRTASQVEESTAKMEAVFGDLSGELRAWSDTTAEALNRSRFELQRTATNFADLLVPMGASREQALDLSTQLTTLTQDLSSFNNVAAKQVQQDLQSALVGQSEAVRKYGIDASQTAVNQELLNMGIQGGTDAATRMQEAQARLNIIMSDSEDALGNAAATSGSFKNQMRGLRASTREARAEIGQELLPVATVLVNRVSGLVDGFANLSEGQQRTAVGLGVVAATIPPVLLGVGTLLTLVSGASAGWATLTGAMGTASATMTGTVIPALVSTQVAAGPVTLPLWAIIAALGILTATVAAAAYAWKNNVGGIRDTATDAFGTVKAHLDAAPGWLLALTGPLGQLYLAWRENLFGVRDLVGSIFGWIGDKIEILKDQIGKIPGVGGDTVSVDAEMDDVETPSKEDLAAGLDAKAAGQSAGKSYASGFNDGLLDDISVDDVEKELQAQYEEMREQRAEAMLSGEETDISVVDLQQAEARAQRVREADSIEDVSDKALADTAERQIRDEQAQTQRRDDVAALLEERGVEGVSASGESASSTATDVDPETAAADAVAQRRGGDGGESTQQADSGSQQTDKFRKALLAALNEALDGRELDLDLSINERQFNDLIDDRIDAKIT